MEEQMIREDFVLEETGEPEPDEDSCVTEVTYPDGEESRKAPFEDQQVFQFADAETAALGKRFPESGVKTLEDVEKLPEGKQIFSLWGKGVPLADAYALCNLEQITEKRVAAAKQSVLNSIHGRDHLKPVHGAPSRVGTVPKDVLEVYQDMNPGIAAEEIAAHYAKHHGL